MNIIRTNSERIDFKELIKILDKELEDRDGNDHIYYAQFNRTDKIKFVVMAYENEKPLGCGALMEYRPDIMEIKRMFVLKGYRRKGIASRILSELENWARELSCSKCILETGKREPEAIELYKKHGYRFIQNYDQYAGIENSLCFEKVLN